MKKTFILSRYNHYVMADKQLSMCSKCGKYFPKVEMWTTQERSGFCMECTHNLTAKHNQAAKGLTIEEMRA